VLHVLLQPGARERRQTARDLGDDHASGVLHRLGNSFAAIGPAKDVFTKRGIGPDQLPPATVTLLPLDEAAERQRAAGVSEQFGAVAPGVVQYTTDVLFRDLWRRPDLAPRDRSLITVSA
jgi:4-carboxymuconolactone decarboxylase